MILELDSGRRRPISSNNIVYFAQDKGSPGFMIEEHHPNEIDLQNITLLNNAVCLSLDGQAHLDWSQGINRIQKNIRPGQISILVANDPHSVRFKSTGRVLVISLDEKLLSYVALEQGYSGEMQPRWTLGTGDAFIRELMIEVLHEYTTSEEHNFAYIESLVTALAAHVIRRYSHDRLRATNPAQGLGPAILKKTVHFIHENLSEDISITRLAGEVELSTAHFARMFKNSTGLSPHQYVLLCRINRSKQLLMDRKLTLAEIAAKTGFCDQSHFTRSFQKLVHTTPSSYARSFRRAGMNGAEIALETNICS